MFKYIVAKINNTRVVKKFPIIIQFTKFCAVGFTNLGVDYLIYWFLTRSFLLLPMVAKTLSFIVAVSWSFTINRRWTFKSNKENISTKYVKFFIANSISMGLNLSLFYIFIEYLKIYDLLALFLVAVIVSVFNFALNYFWTFSDKLITKNLK